MKKILVVAVLLVMLFVTSALAYRNNNCGNGEFGF